ncbi:MAG: class I SAM-dependent methyltransferase [Gammaproteobacteria bacterium]|nr:class I SAM-dependent methyltransferase [Gammaproteobacteria bacterium]MCW5585460.1 class I SAM-dependent methyltransferase [Chromatiales bacterium]
MSERGSSAANTMSNSKFCYKEINELGDALARWYEASPGQRIAAHEREALIGMVADLFGYQLLQLGELGEAERHLGHCPVQRKTLITRRADAKFPSVIRADAQHLPVAADSVDAVILVHTLDFSPDPHQVLREVERVLIAEGRVIIIGFNPFSLWGLWRLFGRWKGAIPWCGHFLSYPRLSDWLTLMGFGIERMDVMEFRPPTRSGQFDAVERLGRRVWPMLAGVYVVRAVKRISRVTPVRQRWSRLRVLGPRAIEPTVREINDV